MRNRELSGESQATRAAESNPSTSQRSRRAAASPPHAKGCPAHVCGPLHPSLSLLGTSIPELLWLMREREVKEGLLPASPEGRESEQEVEGLPCLDGCASPELRRAPGCLQECRERALVTAGGNYSHCQERSLYRELVPILYF